MSIDWLKANAPGFANLSDADVNAISEFAFLWSLFEARVLENDANVPRMKAAINGWRREGSLNEEAYDGPATYFRERYFRDGEFTHHFPMLRLSRKDEEYVRAVMDGSNDDPFDRVVSVFIVIYRLRNNLLHGEKWHYELANQTANFMHANAVLMTALEQHGRLAPH